MPLSIDVDQFHGIEIEEFPAQIAQVALWLVDHQMNLRVSEEFGMYFARIPLKTSPHIIHGNALTLDWNSVLPAERASHVMGNPPFIGHHLQSEEQKSLLRSELHDVSAAGMMDFVSAWYVKAARYIRNTKIEVAFVATNSITQGEQVGILWSALLKEGIRINFAHTTFRWSNEARGKAAVYCVIIGFAQFERDQKILFEYDTPDAEPHARVVSHINPYLIDGPDVLLENRSQPLGDVPTMMYGSKPTDGGSFLFSEHEAKEFLVREPAAQKFIRPFISAHEYLHGEKRFVLWLVDAKPDEIAKLPTIKQRIEAVVAFRKASKAKTTRDYPYPTLFRQVTQPQSSYVLNPGPYLREPPIYSFRIFSQRRHCWK
ncbi:MAG TPA: DNA methyltransferase [Thiobacillus sp.]|nr:DNA methyltransferase [Thiobacillus sp.]